MSSALRVEQGLKNLDFLNCRVRKHVVISEYGLEEFLEDEFPGVQNFWRDVNSEARPTEVSRDIAKKELRHWFEKGGAFGKTDLMRKDPLFVNKCMLLVEQLFDEFSNPRFYSDYGQQVDPSGKWSIERLTIAMDRDHIGMIYFYEDA